MDSTSAATAYGLATTPRFRDEASSTLSSFGPVEIVWEGRHAIGSLWRVCGPSIVIGLPLGAPHPAPGATISLTIRFGSQNVSSNAKVNVVREVHGSILTLHCATPDRNSHSEHLLQRRGNTRFGLSRLFPAFCFANDPVHDRVIPFRVIDLSNGGVALTTSFQDPCIVSGTILTCRFDAPSIGSFRANIAVRSVAVNNSSAGQAFRISAEFVELSQSARSVLASTLAKPGCTNSIFELEREKLLPKPGKHPIDWSFSASSEVRSRQPANAHHSESESAATFLLATGRLGPLVVYSYLFTMTTTKRLSARLLFVDAAMDDAMVWPLVLAEARKRLRASSAGENIAERNRQSIARASDDTRQARSDSSMLARRRTTHCGFTGVRSSTARVKSNVAWDTYAEAYDTMCSANPAYQENLGVFRAWLAQLAVPPNGAICEVGAGTGNFAIEVARAFPTSTVIHLDRDPIMNLTASRKYRRNGLKNVTFMSANARSAKQLPASLDVIVCVNSLYTLSDARTMLSRCYAWLKPGGQMFLIDLGRPMDVLDWSRYIVFSNLRTNGLVATIRALIKGRKAISQNRLIRREQDRGNYWLHSTSEFAAALEKAGFELSTIATCYRGVCDLAICRKPEPTTRSGTAEDHL